jgi:hypothetical protein
MEVIPISILQNNILYHLLPDVYCGFNYFLNLKLVNKTWYNMINNFNTWVNMLTKNKHTIIHHEEFKYFIKYKYSSIGIFNKKNMIYYRNDYEEDYQEDIDSDGETIFIHIPHNLHSGIHTIPKSLTNEIDCATQHTFMENIIRFSLLTFYPNKITNLLTPLEFYNIPELKYLKAEYLDNLMGNLQDGFERMITSRMMRGFDSSGRPFLVFKYKDTINDKIIVETIYFKYNLICNPQKKHGWTFMGRYNSTYIGLLADTDRQLTDYSWDYINNLIMGGNCQVIFPQFEDNKITIMKTLKNHSVVRLID